MVDSDKQTLSRLAGLSVGILLGVILAPLLFRSLNPFAIMGGSLLGAVLGYLVVATILRIRAHRRDAELLRAAEAIRREAGLPETITIKVRGGRADLTGTVETLTQRCQAQEALATLPGLKEISNHIRANVVV
jgi:hypothetical protein